MSWYDLLNIRQQLRRPSLAFYVDKVQYKAHMQRIGVDTPQVYYVRNAEPSMAVADYDVVRAGISNALAKRTDYAAKPTHMSCSDGVYVVKDGRNIYHEPPRLVDPTQVAANLTWALQTRSSLLGESWALHQVPPGVIVEERISRRLVEAGAEFLLLTASGSFHPKPYLGASTQSLI